MLNGHLLSERYRIKKTIGGGGMANVYLARDIILERDVAIKVLRLEYANDAEFIERFDREAQAATSLSHPNIVNIYDVGEEDHILYMVMEYVDGLTLKEYIQQNSPIPVEEALEIMKQLTDAMSHAHANGLIHRDIKPQNVLVDRYGNVKITDFGIAMALTATSLTQTNSILGSVHYLSPEQARGGVATKKSDIYSLGIVLFELLTGQLPFSGQSPVSIDLKHLQNETPSVRDINGEIPQSVENIVLKATAKNPLHRYESAYEMEIALNSALDPDRINEEVYKPPVEEGEETKVIPIIVDEQQVQTENESVRQPVNEQPKAKQKKKKKKSFFKSKFFLSLIILFLASMAGIVLYAALFHTKDVEIPNVVGEPFDDVEQELMDLNLVVEKELTFSEEHEEGIVIKTTPEAGRIVKEKSTVKVLVSEGKSKVEFDDYVGKNFNQVKRLLEQAGYKDIIEWKVKSDKPEGEIINQVQPTPGEEVIPSDTTVIFEISDGPELIRVNRLAGLKVEEARQLVEERGLKLETNEQHSDSVPKGIIIRQSPAENTEVEIGTTIVVDVSLGPEQLPPKSHSVSFIVPFIPEEDDEEGEVTAEQVVQIYIEDMEHSISNVYLEETITEDKEFTLTLVIAPDTTAEYKVVREIGRASCREREWTPVAVET